MIGSICERGPRRRKLLLVSFEQFGYHTDTFEYCRHLGERYRITYLCPDQSLPRKSLAGVDVVYQSRPPLGKVEIGLLLEAHRLLRSQHFALAFLRRTKFSFLLRLRHQNIPMVLDVRSGSIEEGRLQRMIENGLLRINVAFFSNITVVSKGLAKQLRLPNKAHELPLGADPKLVTVDPYQNELRLVYVGTFKNRHLERTVEGLGEFVRRGAVDLPVCYTLVGFGSEKERAAIRSAAVAAGLDDRVTIHGRMDREDLSSLLAEHNIGVAFTPRVPWFEHQPSTKIFEYLQSGLLCIATDNAANRATISLGNGVLVDDTPDGFSRGLEQAAAKLLTWNPRAAADSVRDHTWEAIVTDNLIPYFESVCE
jgi:glycosyltransferase involved in cell wall biosynthesis